MTSLIKNTYSADFNLDLSIICVNWNSVDYLLECIPSIYEYTRDLSFEIIVVDNASPDGKADVLKERFPEITLIKSDTNLGFAGANNLGVKRSVGRNILFLNPDTKLISPAIQSMLACLEITPDVGVVGCKLLNSDLSIQTSCVMGFPRIFNMFVQWEFLRRRWPKLWGIGPLFASDSSPARVEAISGACMMMKREIFERVGGFSEDYFMYAEDVDLCFKVARAGYSNYYVGTGTIVHHAGKTSAPDWQIVMKLRSELLFYRKNYGRVHAMIFRCCLMANAVIRLFIITVLSLPSLASKHKMSLRSAASKWKAIIKALLTPGLSERIFSPRPNNAPN